MLGPSGKRTSPVGYIDSGRGLVFVDETAQQRPLVNFSRPSGHRPVAVGFRSASEGPARDEASPRCSAYVGANDALKVSSAGDERPIQAFGTDGADPPFAERVGVRDRIGVRTILMPSERNTSSKASVNLASRSWIRNLGDRPSSWNVMAKFRACWVTQAESGCEVTPPR